MCASQALVYVLPSHSHTGLTSSVQMVGRPWHMPTVPPVPTAAHGEVTEALILALRVRAATGIERIPVALQQRVQ